MRKSCAFLFISLWLAACGKDVVDNAEQRRANDFAAQQLQLAKLKMAFDTLNSSPSQEARAMAATQIITDAPPEMLTTLLGGFPSPNLKAPWVTKRLLQARQNPDTPLDELVDPDPTKGFLPKEALDRAIPNVMIVGDTASFRLNMPAVPQAKYEAVQLAVLSILQQMADLAAFPGLYEPLRARLSAQHERLIVLGPAVIGAMTVAQFEDYADGKAGRPYIVGKRKRAEVARLLWTGLRLFRKSDVYRDELRAQLLGRLGEEPPKDTD